MEMDFICTVEEIEQQIKEAGEQLSLPPSSTKEILDLLDKLERLLLFVGQAPAISMQSALVPSMGALISNELLRHSDVDVRVSVASCLGEIARITAPEPPYKDETMKEIFQLNVMAFRKLSDVSGRNYYKAIHILESVAKVKSCLLMLDLECDALITEMFEQFLGTIRSNHPHTVFSDMETIMTLVIEESDEIPIGLVSLLLSYVKKENQKVSPVPWKLAEKVLKNCTDILKSYSQEVMKLMTSDPDDYAEVVTSLCLNSNGNELMEGNSVMDDGTRKRDDALENVGSAKTPMHQENDVRVPKKRGRKPKVDNIALEHRLKGKELEAYQTFSCAHESHSTRGQLKNKKILNQGTSPYLMEDSNECLLRTQLKDKALHSGVLALEEKSKGLKDSKGKPQKGSTKTKDVDKTTMETPVALNGVVIKKEDEVLSDSGGAEEPLFRQVNDKRRRGRPSSKKHVAGGFHQKDFKDACACNEYAKELVGRSIQVWWPLDKMYYEGAISSYDPRRKKHKVLYADGDEEILDLRHEKWKLVDETPLDQVKDADLPGPTTSVKPRKRKAKSKREFSIKQEDDCNFPESLGSDKFKTEPVKQHDIRGSYGPTTNPLCNVEDPKDGVAQLLDIRYGPISTEEPDAEAHERIGDVEQDSECHTSSIAAVKNVSSQEGPLLCRELEERMPGSAVPEEGETKTGKRRRRLVKNEEFVSQA